MPFPLTQVALLSRLVSQRPGSVVAHITRESTVRRDLNSPDLAYFERGVIDAVREALNLPLSARLAWFAHLAAAVAKANRALPAPQQRQVQLVDGEEG